MGSNTPPNMKKIVLQSDFVVAHIVHTVRIVSYNPLLSTLVGEGASLISQHFQQSCTVATMRGEQQSNHFFIHQIDENI